MSEAPLTPEELKAKAEADDEAKAEKRLQRQDIIAGVTLAVFAAALAICDLGAGKYGDDEILAANEKAGAYSWFQSKSMKQTLVEGEGDLLSDLLEAGVIKDEAASAMEAHIFKLKKKAAKYELQKNEILLGSAAVGKEKWAQDVEGEMGKIVGAKAWEKIGGALSKAGDVFDFGTLFLQLCLVMGAIGIVMTGMTAKRLFYATMVVLGLVGCVYTWQAFGIAFSIPAA